MVCFTKVPQIPLKTLELQPKKKAVRQIVPPEAAAGGESFEAPRESHWGRSGSSLPVFILIDEGQ